MIRAVVTGVAGRMGSQIVRAVRDSDEFQLVGATERPGTAAIGLDAGLAAGLGMLEVPVSDSLDKAIRGAEGADVVIDFTTTEASMRHAAICVERRVALVVGSTGFSPEARAQMAAAAQTIPMVMAPNMSIGVNLLIKVVGQIAEVLGPGFDVEIL